MFKIVTLTNPSNIHKENRKEKKLFLQLNGEVLQDISVMDFGSHFVIDTRSQESTDLISQSIIKDLPIPTEINLTNFREFDDFGLTVEIDNTTSYDEKDVTFMIIPTLEFWKKTFSFVEYKELFLEILEDNVFNDNDFTVNDEKVSSDYFIEILFHHLFTDKPLVEEIKEYVESAWKVHNEVVGILNSYNHKNSISTFFNLPESLKVPCEQYLSYFVQFLQDLGIKATSDFKKEEAGKVLFSVTPTDDVEALDKIREALAVYLKLPESPIVYDDSFAAMRLQQQIENLQHSQRMAVRELQSNEKLLTAQSDMIHEKNVTISQLQSVTDQQQKIIEKISSKSIMMDSVENKEELEELFDGLKIGESKWLYEKTGIKANPVKIIKTAVKNTFGKGDEIISLDLGKDT